MSDRGAFFKAVRADLFHGKLSQAQVDGMNAILDVWDDLDGATPCLTPSTPLLRAMWRAYSLATAFHETGATMQPIREWGRGEGKLYGLRDQETGQVYYGRGFVQLTWRENYQRQALRLKIDLVHNPDLAMEIGVAARILVEGMVRGDFSGRSLAAYFNSRTVKPLDARKIINGMDRAALVAGYHAAFLAALAPPA